MDILYVSIVFLSLTSVTLANDCDLTDSPLLCQGARVVRSVVNHILNDTSDSTPLQIVPGLEIVEVLKNDSDVNGTLKRNSDNGYLGRVQRYLQKHELRIKLPSLDINEVDGDLETKSIVRDVVEARKKDKGMGMVLMLALMMKKMLAALGIAAVGALAAKALGVALLAFLLASIIGIKKLTESSHDDGGHHVQYVTAHTEHHRRRREIDEDIPLPYRGWIKNTVME